LGRGLYPGDSSAKDLATIAHAFINAPRKTLLIDEVGDEVIDYERCLSASLGVFGLPHAEPKID
jgi:hypothetical protein